MRLPKVFFLTLVCLFLIGSARAQTPTPPGSGPPPGAEVKKPEPSKPKPFAEIVKDAEAVKGLFTLYRTEDNVYLEILPEQLEKPYLLSMTRESGIGERGFYAAQMIGNALVVFHKQGKNIQLVEKNTRFTAREKTPIADAVARSFSDAILGATRIESLPHPERKSVLIDLGAVLLTDVPMLSYGLESTFRIPYRFDSKNSAFGAIKGFPENVEIETIAHYAAERPPIPPLPSPAGPPPPAPPPPPRTLADVRSMQFRLRYSLAERPQTGYRPRLADDRVGHFFVQHEDYTNDSDFAPSRRYIRRWHLEKQDPSAAMSRPKQPIVFWLERTIPLKYRDAIRDGVLLWNKAFERIGFQDAIEVKQQPEDAEWDAADSRYSTIRWFINTDSGFAIGPSYSDPLTGQTYDADIGFSESMTRFSRREVSEEVKPISWSGETRPVFLWGSSDPGAVCDMAEGAIADAGFGYDVLLGRGVEPEGPESEEFVRQYLVHVTAHEVGHTLGLRHNFRASTIHPFEKLQDKDLTLREGMTASVMDYQPVNLSLDRAHQGEYFQTTLGPYDYWAIEYAYKPIAAATPEDELPELRKIASRVADPMFAYGTDEEAGLGGPEPWDMDPTVNRWDLGSDPLKYYAHRVQLGREVWKNLEGKLEKPGEGYQILRRSFGRALSQVGLALGLTAKYIGGVYHYRDHIGDPSGRLPYQPVPASKQREALELLRANLFSSTAFVFTPRLLNKLAIERFSDFLNPATMQTRFDFPVHAQVLALQKSVLDRVYQPVVLARILDSEVKVADPFTIGDLFNGLQETIWAETKVPGTSLKINTYRRGLQREHLKKLVGLVLRGEGNPPEDARTMARANLVALRSQLRGALARQGLRMPFETSAHISESLARIDEVLKANAQRSAF